MEAVAEEEWRPVVGYEGQYEVSDLGRVRSLDRVVPRRKGDKVWPMKRRGQLLRPGTMKSGHLIVVLGSGAKTNALVHHLVLKAFVGPRLPGHESLHGDGDPANNRPGNLRWGTRAENIQDSIRHGTKPRGENHQSAILKEADVVAIKALLKTQSQTALGRRFGVSRSTIWKIAAGLGWKHVAAIPEAAP